MCNSKLNNTGQAPSLKKVVSQRKTENKLF